MVCGIDRFRKGGGDGGRGMVVLKVEGRGGDCDDGNCSGEGMVVLIVIVAVAARGVKLVVAVEIGLVVIIFITYKLSQN